MELAAAGAAAGGDHDLPLEDVDALLASFSGDPAVFVPPPEPVIPVESPREGLWEIERFLMEDVDEAAVADGADEFLDAVLAGDEEGSPVGGGSTDGASEKEDEEAVGVGVDGDDPNSKKKRR